VKKRKSPLRVTNGQAAMESKYKEEKTISPKRVAI
jgi:hypothetical protein